MATEVTAEELVELALAPANIAVDGQSVSERSIDDIIKADKYASAKTAMESTNSNGGRLGGWGSAIRERFKPPGGA